jgi:hypothetical protein
MRNGVFATILSLSTIACGQVLGIEDPVAVVDANGPPDGQPMLGHDSADPACDVSKPFDAPIEVDGVNSTNNEWSAAPSADGLSIFVGSDRPGAGNNVWSTTRSTTGDPFAPASELTVVNMMQSNTFATSLSRDGRTLFLQSDRTGNYEIYTATRDTIATTFEMPAVVSNVNTAANDGDARILPDGSAMYLASDVGGDSDLYRAPLTGGGQFGRPDPIGELNTAANEWSPAITVDELTLFFARSEDIYVARRTTSADGFGEAIAVAELNTPAIDRPAAVSADGCTLWIVTNGQAGTGGMDVFTASRPR